MDYQDMQEHVTVGFVGWLNMQRIAVGGMNGSAAINGHDTEMRVLGEQHKTGLGMDLCDVDATTIITILMSLIMGLFSSMTEEAAARSCGAPTCSLALTSPRRTARCACTPVARRGK
jgi:hypothetical protein